MVTRAAWAAAQLHFSQAAGQPCCLALLTGITPLCAGASCASTHHHWPPVSLCRGISVFPPEDMQMYPEQKMAFVTGVGGGALTCPVCPSVRLFGACSAAFLFLNPCSSLMYPLPPRLPSLLRELWNLSPWFGWLWTVLRFGFQGGSASSVAQADAVWGSFSAEFVCKQHTAPDCWWLSNSLAN